MYAHLNGILTNIFEDHIVIDCNGVGFFVYLSKHSVTQLPKIGEKVFVLVQSIIKEDSHQLVGFITNDEKDLFKKLYEVQGVGLKMALSILSILPPDSLRQAIIQQNKAVLMQAHGVGAKLASRVLLELKNKLRGGGESNEAVDALIKLGYSPTDAMSYIQKAYETLGPQASTEDIIKTALKKLV